MERLQDKRIWFGGGAIAALLIIALGWFIFIGPERASVSDSQARAAATEQQNAVLQSKLNSLKADSARLPRYTASLGAAVNALPADSGLPEFTRQITAQAVASRVQVSSVAVGASAAVAATAPTATGSAGTNPAAPATTPTAAPTATTPAPAAGATPATPTTASAAGTLVSFQVTILSTGSLPNQLTFLNDLRTAGPRRALLTSTELAPAAGAKEASIDQSALLTTQLTIFSAPQTTAQIAQLKKLLSGKIGN